MLIPCGTQPASLCLSTLTNMEAPSSLALVEYRRSDPMIPAFFRLALRSPRYPFKPDISVTSTFRSILTASKIAHNLIGGLRPTYSALDRRALCIPLDRIGFVILTICSPTRSGFFGGQPYRHRFFNSCYTET